VRWLCARSAFFTNCCVIVEPPCTALLLHDFLANARAMPRMSTAGVRVEAAVLDRDDRVAHVG
jgi:hypothetical protein